MALASLHRLIRLTSSLCWHSFISSEAQPLADIEEFCGKITAAKEAQSDPNFVVVARVEAFIAGHSKEEALRRAEAYRKAGADAILMRAWLCASGGSGVGDRHDALVTSDKSYF
jgi:phosphoenolpyruvate phosphomutase